MFLLDTNVVSELRRAEKADRRVTDWADSVSSTDLFLSCITVLELETGALLLARRDRAQGKLIQNWIHNRVLPAFGDRILSIDTAVSLRCASLHVPDPRPYRDSLIAATAIVHGLIVVTRNHADFESMEVSVVDPWKER